MSVLTFVFFNDPPTTEIYTLSLHDALPICFAGWPARTGLWRAGLRFRARTPGEDGDGRGTSTPRNGHGAKASRSEEHTSELQSRQYLVCRLLLEKKKKHETQID